MGIGIRLLVCVLLGLVTGTQCGCDFKARGGEYVLCANHPSVFEVGGNSSLKIYARPALPPGDYILQVHHKSSILRISHEVILSGGNATHIPLQSRRAGIETISFSFNSTEENVTFYKLKKVKREISVVHSKALDIFSIVVGWVYFAAWSISFYPQIVENFRRRSVVGLNFDFLALNITGFVSYLMFNIGLFWIPSVQQQYKNDHPGGVNPVQINDVVFTLHACAATLFTIFQCFIFERGKQRVSILAWIILALLWLAVIISLFVSVGGKLSWLNFLYVFSYVKLAVTLIKYIPQVVMNCRRGSTVGWSIGNVLLDFTGGTFSLVQMFVISYNYDDWQSIFGDPTKFGLGVFSIAFDLIFIFQHYCLFWGKQPREEEAGGYKKIEEKCLNRNGNEVLGPNQDPTAEENDSLLLRGDQSSIWRRVWRKVRQK